MNVAKCVFGACLAIVIASTGAAAPPKSPRIDGVEILVDQGWSDNTDVIWYDNFDSTESLVARYLEAGSDGGDFVPVTDEALGGSGNSVRARFQQGKVGAGGLKKMFGRNPMDYRGLGVRKGEDFTEIYWRHYVKHQDGWIGNPAKLSRATAFASSDWSQAMVAHIWGGNSLNLATDPVRAVNAQSQVVASGYNDFDNFSWLGLRHGATQIFDTAESGRWVSVEGHVKLNSPGQSNGIFTLYIDGQVEVSRNDLNWVYSWDDYGINAVFLENYWNSGSPVEQERFFDDFVISTSYIGLAKSPLNPRVTKTDFHDPDSNDSQSAWRLQIASDINGSDVVWDSGQIDGAGLSIAIDAANGMFRGSLDGSDRLMADKLYALRVQQRDMSGNWSPWSHWSTSLQTGLSVADLNCDFDASGACNVADLNALLAAFGGSDSQFDLNDSGRVDVDDRDAWLISAGDEAIGAPFVTGDADLDGDVDAVDLNALGRNWLSDDGPRWQEGNFNGDNIVDAQDLNAIGRNWQHGVAPAAPSPAAVPEPSSLAILAVGMCVLAAIRRDFLPGFDSCENARPMEDAGETM